jgi:hypothetical protein
MSAHASRASSVRAAPHFPNECASRRPLRRTFVRRRVSSVGERILSSCIKARVGEVEA